MKKNRFGWSILIVCLLFSSQSGWSEVNVWEGTLSIPTYPWGEDINPKFFALEESIIYPYTMQDNLAREKVDREYQAVYLENEYLKVTCLPELAGRIFSVLDKTTNQEMFHKNPVVKPGMIGMRGAWFSGGIEWNTGPHAHSVTIVTPVNVTAQKNEDGSATLAISNTEQIFRTRWTVYLTLHPGKAYLDERIAIANPTDFVHPYYFWNCTAFYCLPGTRFIYPMTLGTDHSGTSFFSWPIDHGKDLTWLKNYEEPTSVFAYDCVFDFFGAYDTGLDRGIVQYANHHELIGKKAWTWGQSESGLVRERNLHDFNEQYIEVQSGPLLTQADYGLLGPHEKIQWQEWWYPVHGLGEGFEYATLELAIQRIEKEGKLEFRFISTGDYEQSKLLIRKDQSILREETIDLSPATPVSIQFEKVPDGFLTLTVTSREGVVLADYQSPLPIPLQTPPAPDWKSTKTESELGVEEMYLKGLLFDKQTDRKQARAWYEKTLAQDPLHTLANRGIAVLDLEAGLFDKVIERLNPVLVRNPDDGLSWFYLGTAYFNLQKWDEALECAYKAVKSQATAPVGYDLAGRVSMRTGHYSRAIESFKKALTRQPDDSRTRNHLLLASYRNGDIQTAQSMAQRLAKVDPTDPVPQAVLALIKKEGLTGYIEAMRKCLGEFDFEMIETALIFTELEMPEAFDLLQNAFDGETANSQNPLPFYYLAYLANANNDKESLKKYLVKAESLSGDGIFPSRLEMIPMLRFAMQSSAESDCSASRACLHLGNLLAGLGRMDEAREPWKKAVELNPSLSVAWRNLGILAWKQDKDLESARIDYQHAIQSRPEDMTLYRDLAQIYLDSDRRQEAIRLLEPLVGKKDFRIDMIEILAQSYNGEKEYSRTIDLLSRSFFSNWEGRNMSRNLFVRAHLERGRQRMNASQFQDAYDDFSAALTFPENLGVGRAPKEPEAEAFYWQGKALQSLGRLSEAKKSWEQGVQSSPAEFRDLCQKALEENR